MRPEVKGGALISGRLTYIPVVPGRVEFASEVRRLILELNPSVVAVELPGKIREHYLRAVGRLPEMTVVVYPDPADDDRAIYIPVEPADPFTEAVRSAREIEAGVIFLEPDDVERPHLPDAYPDSYTARRIGIDRYIAGYREGRGAPGEAVLEHAQAMAWKLQGTDPDARILVVVALNMFDALVEAMDVPQENPPQSRTLAAADLINPHPDCLVEICTEYPYLQDRYEFHRLGASDERLIDKPRVQIDLLRDAAARYSENTGENLAHWHRRLLARYTRNLAWTSGGLVASAFDLAVAARSIVDDNYGYEVWQMANRYPSQQAKCELETVNLSGEEVWINTRRIRIRRRLPRPKQRLKSTGLKPRKKERFPGDWAVQTGGVMMCSYPPEDLLIEDYGRFLKKKAKAMLSEERARVEPFTTSILDGIDIRETIRNWHERKIYVRQLDRIAGEFGAVVVIFDEDRQDRYTYLTTWLGEHQNESDMAFYSSDPFENVVGPGIGRGEYGGFVMVLPPRRMMDVWTDPDYDFAETKPERLLLAALDYSVERHIVYVAAKPPRSIFRSISERLGRKIVFIPIGQLSPTKFKKLRVVHVLDSYERRKIAKDYIW